MLLRALSVFEDGAARAAVDAVCAGDAGGAGALQGLVRRSLLREEKLPDQPTRYRLLEPVRQFARRRLTEAGEEEIVVRRHRDYYLQLTETWERDLLDDRSRPAIEKLVRRETSNLRAALLACAEDIVGTAARLWRAQGVWRHLFRRDFAETEEGHRWLARLMETTGGTASEETAARARALLLVGRFLIASPAYPLARGVFEAGLSFAKRTQDKAAIAEIELMLGHLATDKRDWASARRYCEESRRLYAVLGDTTNEARALSYLCDIVLQERDIPAARVLTQELFDAAREIAVKSDASPQDQDQLATAWHRLGLIAEAEQCWEAAAANHIEALGLYDALGNRAACLVVINSLGRVRAGEGALEESAYLFGATDAWGKRVHAHEKYPDRHQAFVAAARLRMEEASFRAAWEAGRAAEWKPLLGRASTGPEPRQRHETNS
jgi:non-specific serine/threonine protein kinase